MTGARRPSTRGRLRRSVPLAALGLLGLGLLLAELGQGARRRASALDGASLAPVADLRASGAMPVAQELELAAGKRSRVPPSTDAIVEEAPRAVLSVTVRSKLDGQEVSGLGATLVKAAGDAGAEVRHTDEFGALAFPIDPGVPYVLHVGTDGPSGVRIERVIEPMGEEEARELELEIDLPLDLISRGSIVDEGTHLPIQGARVRLHLPEVEEIAESQEAAEEDWSGRTLARIETDAAGRFELRYPSWRKAQLEVAAEGYATRYVLLDRDADRRARELELDLPRVAGLEVVVRVGGSPLAACEVEVDVETSADLAQGDTAFDWVDYEMPPWTGRCDEAGRARFANLPPRCELSVGIELDHKRFEPEGGHLRLEPGEARELVVDLDGFAELTGNLIDDSDGTPVAGATIWLLRATDDEPELLCGRQQVFESVRTDARGAFTFHHVPAGRWRVGPATNSDQSVEAPPAPFSRPVRLAAGELATIELRLPRYLFLSGRVVDADGRAVEGADVRAAPADLDGCANASTSVSGEFFLGPLVPGRYTVYAEQEQRRSPSVVADPADDQPLELRFSRGGRVSGSIVAPNELAPLHAEVVLSLRADDPRAAELWWAGERTTLGVRDAGRFDFEGVEPGRYDILVSTDRGECAFLRELEVGEGEALDELRLELHRGARIAFTPTRSIETAEVEIFLAGELVQSAWADRDFGPGVVVPAGELLVQIRDFDFRIVEERRLQVQVGEQRRVELP